MEVSRIIAEIDLQISNLQKARALLAETSLTTEIKIPSRRGRPKGSKNTPPAASTKKSAKIAKPVAAKSKRKLSPEGRKRIAEAMKKRWAERKKEPAK